MTRVLIAACSIVFAVAWSFSAPQLRPEPVIAAAMRGDMAELRRLVDQRMDVNAAQPDGATALHWAVHRGDIQAVELLIRGGANVKALNRNGVSPLYLASLYGHSTIVM